MARCCLPLLACTGAGAVATSRLVARHVARAASRASGTTELEELGLLELDSARASALLDSARASAGSKVTAAKKCEEFDPCWTGRAWKRSPACSGVPPTWESALLADEFDALCQRGSSEAPVAGCSKLSSMCHARRALLGQGCTTSEKLRQLRGGDSIYLRASSHNYVDINGSEAHARWPNIGLWQTLVMERSHAQPGSDISRGDVVLLRTHEGTYLTAEGKDLRAQTRDASSSDAAWEFVLESEGNGTVAAWSSVSFRSRDGGRIAVVDRQLVMSHGPVEENQQFTVEKELRLADSIQLNFGAACSAPAASDQDVLTGQALFLRSQLTGNLLDVADAQVRARWPDFGDWQRLFIEKEEDTEQGDASVRSGDPVFLRTNEETHLELGDAGVQAQRRERGPGQRLWLERDGPGPVRCGDVVRVRSGNKTLLVDGEAVVANASLPSDAAAQFRVDKGRFEQTLGFIHIPKNAGTAVEDAGWNTFDEKKTYPIRWGRWAMFGMLRIDEGEFCSMHHTPPDLLPVQQQDTIRTTENFCITRHPYDRAISEYSYRLASVGDNETLRARVKQSLLKYPACSEEGLNFYLSLQLRRVLNGHPTTEDCHFLPQSDYIWGKERQWCAHVLRMDEFPRSFNALMEEKGYPTRLTADPQNRTNFHGDLCPNLSWKALNGDTTALLDHVFAVDFRRLDYSPKDRS